MADVLQRLVETMKLWIDLSNAPHAQFFSGFIEQLRRSEHKILVTSREIDHLPEILNSKGIEHKVVGEHGGGSLKGKLKASSKRIYELTDVISQFDPDISISKHSVEAPRVAYGLDIPSILICDNEHEVAPNKLSFSIVDEIIVPSFVSEKKLINQGANPEKITQYNGFSELAHIDNFNPNPNVLKNLDLEQDQEIVVIRTEPVNANYYEDNKRSIAHEIIPRLKEELDPEIVLFPRTEDQRKRLSRFDVKIPDNTVDALSLLYYSDLMIGAGGTMNRESVALGTPAISTYSQRLLSVTKHLLKKDLLEHQRSPKMIVEKSRDLIGTDLRNLEELDECISPLNVLRSSIIEMLDQFGELEKESMFLSTKKTRPLARLSGGEGK